jgi:hypothetical protein
MIDTQALAEKILSAIEDHDPAYQKRGFTFMSTTRRRRVVEEIEEILGEALRVGCVP